MELWTMNFQWVIKMCWYNFAIVNYKKKQQWMKSMKWCHCPNFWLFSTNLVWKHIFKSSGIYDLKFWWCLELEAWYLMCWANRTNRREKYFSGFQFIRHTFFYFHFFLVGFFLESWEPDKKFFFFFFSPSQHCKMNRCLMF